MLCIDHFAMDLMIRQEVIQLIIKQFKFQQYLITQATPWTSELRKLFLHVRVFWLAVSSDLMFFPWLYGDKSFLFCGSSDLL